MYALLPDAAEAGVELPEVEASIPALAAVTQEVLKCGSMTAYNLQYVSYAFGCQQTKKIEWVQRQATCLSKALSEIHSRDSTPALPECSLHIVTRHLSHLSLP